MAISFLHPIGSGYRAWAMLMMFGFPCLYFVWNNRGDYDELYRRLSAATLMVGMSYYLYCFFKAGRGELSVVSDRMAGAFYDANMFSMIGMIMVSCSLYMLLVNRNSRVWFVFTAIGFGIGNDITFLGQSRLSILVVFGSMMSFAIYILKNRTVYLKEKGYIRVYLRSLALLMSLIVFLFAGRTMLAVNTRAIEENTTVNTASIETVFITSDTEENGEALDRFSMKGKNIDSYTNGRYNIWKNYAYFLNMTGNDFSKADWSVLTGNTVKHAHNNFLEIGYRCGVPVAIIHTILELYAGIVCLIWLFGRRYKEPYYLFSIVFMVTYAVQSLFDIATIPFERPAPFFFYMAMIPVFVFGSEQRSSEIRIGIHER